MLVFAVATAAKAVINVNPVYGYVTLRKSAFLALPRPVAHEVVGSVVQYFNANTKFLTYRELQDLHKVMRLGRTSCLYNCNIFPIHNEDFFGVSHMKQEEPHPIKVGESVQWNQWSVTVSPENSGQESKETQFYIRNFTKTDQHLLRFGVRVVKSFKLPPVLSRYSLPVIEDRHGHVVLIPHFRYKDKDFGISAKVKHQPPIALDAIVKHLLLEKYIIL
jgi:hypothetical protein